MSKTIALLGNQNCGKTTLFNILTGSSQHVGNFPGLTVEKKEGTFHTYHHEYQLIDLPGIYSLTPYSQDEIVAIDYLLLKRPQLILNVIDASHLERSLYLTLQLLELNIPMLLVFNMMDEVKKQGMHIDVRGLESQLGIRIIPMYAKRKKERQALIQGIDDTITHACSYTPFYNQKIMNIRKNIASLIEKQCLQKRIPIEYCVSQLIEGHQSLIHLTYSQEQLIHEQRHLLSKQDPLTAFISARYTFIDRLCHQYISIQPATKHHFSYDIDRILTHRYLGIPIFFIIMFFVFYLSFSLIGLPLQNLFAQCLEYLFQLILTFFKQQGLSKTLLSLFQDGLFVGVGSVLSFLPVIIVLFFFLSLLEDSGYMTRVAFLMDRLLRGIGLTGCSIVPLLIGFGCNVPALMATRTLSSEKDRQLTMMMIPFMSCSAKLPIYAMITHTFFQNKMIVVMFFIYFLSIGIAVIYAFILEHFVFQHQEISTYILELPHYRLPRLKNTYQYVLTKAKDFVYKAFTVIFITSLVIWFLQYFQFHLQPAHQPQESILATIGQTILPLFYPLGIEHYQATTAIISGICAKESVVSTLQILSTSSLTETLTQIFTPLSALSFLTFTVLYMPCMATFATLKKEFHSLSQAVMIMVCQTSIAYIVSFFIYQIGKLLI